MATARWPRSFSWLRNRPLVVKAATAPCPGLAAGLVGMPGGRVGHVQVAVDGLHVERDEPGRELGVDERVGAEAVRGELAVEDVDVPCASLAA